MHALVHWSNFCRSALVFAVLTLAALAALGCETAAPPSLISAAELSPREAEVGDRLEISGEGFPKGKTGRVTFRGVLHRPGEAHVETEIEAQGLASSGQRIELPLTESLQALFCGRGDRAMHTTFRGTVEVAFPAAAPGAPPIAASVPNVVLDLRAAPPRRAIVEERRAEAERTLAFLGFHVEERAEPSGGLVVQSVAPGSRAEAARLAAGDVITSFDGVRVSTIEDLVPSASSARVAIGVRGERGEVLREAAVDGLLAAPRDLTAGALIVAVLAGVVLLFFAPSAELLAWLERRVAAHLSPNGRAATLRSLVRRIRDRRAPLVAALCASVLFAAMPFGRYVVLAELDIVLLFLVALAALAIIGGLAGGWRAAVRSISFEIPAVIAAACVVIMTGSTRLHDIVRAQGAAPWEWNALRSPVAFALFALHLTSALARSRPAPPMLAEAAADDRAPDATQNAPSALARRALFVAESANVAVACATGATLFLGGWQIPGATLGQAHGAIALELAGSALFLLKAAGILAFVLGARSVLPVLRVEQTMRLFWRWLIPLAGLGLALTVGWLVWSPSAALEHGVAVGTCALVGIAALRFAHRVRFSARARAVGVPVSPFL